MIVQISVLLVRVIITVGCKRDAALGTSLQDSPLASSLRSVDMLLASRSLLLLLGSSRSSISRVVNIL